MKFISIVRILSFFIIFTCNEEKTIVFIFSWKFEKWKKEKYNENYAIFQYVYIIRMKIRLFDMFDEKYERFELNRLSVGDFNARNLLGLQKLQVLSSKLLRFNSQLLIWNHNWEVNSSYCFVFFQILILGTFHSSWKPWSFNFFMKLKSCFLFPYIFEKYENAILLLFFMKIVKKTMFCLICSEIFKKNILFLKIMKSWNSYLFSESWVFLHIFTCN